MAEILVNHSCGGWPGVEPRVAQAARAALEVAGPPVLNAWFGPGSPLLDAVEVSITLADNATVRRANRQYRGRDKTTNVLSFAQNDGAEPPSPLLGDILLAWGTVRDEARDQGKTLADHLTHLVVHGVLHLLGYDHERSPAEAARQEAMEVTILAGLGVADPYA